MAEVSDLSSVLTESLQLNNYGFLGNNSEKTQAIRQQLNNIPSVLDESTLTKLRNGGYEISLKEYTDMNTYNVKMAALYGNSSANKFQNILNIAVDSAEDSLANAKAFVDKMRQNGMSNSTALKTYSALQKYSLMTSFGNYNFVKAKV